MFKGIKKIRTKILLPTISVFLIALSLTAGVSAYLSYDSTLKTLTQTMIETIEVASKRMTAELKVYTTLLSDLAGNVQEIEPDHVMTFMDDVKERHGFANISITDPAGKIGGSDVSVAEYSFYKVPREQSVPYVSEPIPNSDGNGMTMYISAPVLTDGRFDGIVFVGLDAKDLTTIISSINIGKTGNAAIIDSKGTTIAYTDYDIVLSAYNTQVEEKSDSKLARLAALEREVMAGNSGFGSYSYGGADKFMSYAPISGTSGWGMYITVSQSEFMRGTYAGIFFAILISLISLIVAVAVVALIARSISHPITEVANAAIKIAQGDYDSEITHTSLDEIGSLADSMRLMSTTTKEIIEDTARGLGEIAHGNFDLSPQTEYIGVFKKIENSMLLIISGLSDTMTQIKVSAAQVSSGSEQVASGSQALAQGATQQASSIQELSASISDVSDQIKHSAVNASEVNALAHSAGEKLGYSGQQMDMMMSAMSEISSSSSEIGKIIKTIEDIAFQTNILALNAAVEAARAGAAGKGFAVVADEVRNLANKSSAAAKQTNVLIESSLKSVENGVRIANETASSLTDVVAGSLEMANMITLISKATSEQSALISQINQGVDQISVVVQTNSATSEESAAASEELNSQAATLSQLMARFTLKS